MPNLKLVNFSDSFVTVLFEQPSTSRKAKKASGEKANEKPTHAHTTLLKIMMHNTLLHFRAMLFCYTPQFL